jgi:hypothetical protein
MLKYFETISKLQVPKVEREMEEEDFLELAATVLMD